MATRSGSVDPGLILDLMHRGTNADEIEASVATPVRPQRSVGAERGHARDPCGRRGRPCRGLALKVFRHRLLQELGAMAASLNGVDVLAFTGGIGEHDQDLRDEIREAITWWGTCKLT